VFLQEIIWRPFMEIVKANTASESMRDIESAFVGYRMGQMQWR